MLRRLAAVILTAVLVAAGAGAARATSPTIPAAGPVHGECTFNSLSVSVTTSFSASGTGTCVANGTTTTGTVTITGTMTLNSCPVRVATGNLTLSLGGAFPLVTGSARVASEGTSATIVVAGGLSAGAGSFVDVLRSTGCAPQTVWTGTLAF